VSRPAGPDAAVYGWVVTSVDTPWFDLVGTANTRDVGGLPASRGLVRRGLLIRSDNLQDLTPEDVTLLVDDVGVRTVIDLRTNSERAQEGPAPLEARPEVLHLPLSLIPDDELLYKDPSVVLPDRWADGAVGAYLHFLRDIPSSIRDAVRRLADPASGGSIVHCAAGKDRTGVLTAVVLDTLGVDREHILADYELTNARIEGVFARLAQSSTYAVDVQRIGMDAHRVSPDTIDKVLVHLDEFDGGSAGYLRSVGLTEAELDRLHERFVRPG
jgi:protein tyrosine/serine phosphatase